MLGETYTIFYCIDEHLPTDTYEMNLWGPHAMKGTEGAKIIDELKAYEGKKIVVKKNNNDNKTRVCNPKTYL